MGATKFEKMRISLKYLLKGKGYKKALVAFYMAEKYHNGLRKDGVTPEFYHQIEICQYILTLKDINNEEDVLCAALLHDIREDYHIEHREIEQLFGDKVAYSVEKLTKKFKGSIKPYDVYFEEISNDPIASIVKGSDRINNASNMIGVFTKEKQLNYIEEIEKFFLPMLKKSIRNFPDQEDAYLNIITILKQLVKLVKAIHEK